MLPEHDPKDELSSFWIIGLVFYGMISGFIMILTGRDKR